MSEQEALKQRVTDYWANRSSQFLQEKQREFHSPIARRWVKELRPYIPGRTPLKVLDIGCGVGFLSGLLAQMGHCVTGIDLTEEMIAQAEVFKELEEFEAEFLVMDAEFLNFDDETFDIVISRNVTWTLPHADQAYRDWLRVLKKDGLLLNIDGNYGASSMSDTKDLPKVHAHHTLTQETLAESESIQREMPISKYERPQWDASILAGLDIQTLTIDKTISDRIYIRKDEFYNPTPLFLVCVQK